MRSRNACDEALGSKACLRDSRRPETPRGIGRTSSGFVSSLWKGWKAGSGCGSTHRCTICTEFTCTFREVCAWAMHCRVLMSQIRTRSASLHEAAWLPSTFSAQLETEPVCPMSSPSPSLSRLLALTSRNSPFLQAHKISEPVGPTDIEFTGADSDRDRMGWPVPMSQRRTERSRLAEATTCCRPFPGSRAREVTDSECPDQLWKGLGV
mmetsp:Transcript_136291/g.436143  ORF Transcript_136291/g.436143 Transcript_136291/m.436143 type:complete len:209 (+) Transcript_136291:452-1078(+)